MMFFRSKPPPPPPPAIALFNHGGGLRGLIAAHIMTRIEKETGLFMSDMVDVFAGPSTGAILNAALNVPHPDKPDRPKYRARHLVRFYEREGRNIFPLDRYRAFRGLIHDFNNRTMRLSQLGVLFQHGHYHPRHLAHALKRLYGDTYLHETRQSLIVPVYNIDGDQLQLVQEAGEGRDAPVHTLNNFVDEGGHAVWLKNILFNQKLPTWHAAPKVSLFDAVMASTAAPTYFPCHHFDIHWQHKQHEHGCSGIDGSIFDNPCITYHGALRQHLLPDQDLVMIVLGTGTANRSIKKEDWDRYGALGVVDPVNDLPLINIFFNAPESALLECFAEEMKDRLYVFNKSLLKGRTDDWPDLAMDNGDPENLKKMKNFAHIILEENAASLARVCDLLVRNRDRKQEKKKFL